MWIIVETETTDIIIAQEGKEYKINLLPDKYYHIDDRDYGKLYVNGKEVK